MELDELRAKAHEQEDYRKRRFREHYAYAKSLGFSASEAAILSKTTKEEIHRLAQEKRERDAK